MSHVDSGAAGGGPKGRASSQDFELNLAPIIDCFVVLIAFLLISSSYLAIGMMDAGIQAGQATPTAEPPPVQVTVELGDKHTIRVKVKGKANESVELAANENGAWALDRLEKKMQELHRSWPGLEGIVLTAHPDVEYRDVVAGLEKVRKVIPSVLLGEF